MSAAESVPTGPERFGHLEFNAPLAGWRAERLVRELAATEPALVVDFGCGQGALLRRLAAAAGQARCLGIDLDAELLRTARAETTAAGLQDRVSFVEADAAGWHEGSNEPAPDLVICVGATHAWGSTTAAVSALAELVAPGGRVLLGEEFWERPPTDADLASLWEGATADELSDLAGLVELATTAGLRPLRIEAVDQTEWDDFESGFLADQETWLMAHSDDPRAAKIRAEADEHRSFWLRGQRGLLGFAYLTLGRPAAPA